MGFREWFGMGRTPELVAAASAAAGSAALVTTAAPSFALDTDTIDSGVLYGTPTLSDYISAWGTRIGRDEALRVPAVKRARDLICATIGQFPLRLYTPAGVPMPWSLLDQPETGVARSVTITRTVEDLLFYGRSWWQHANLGWHGKPVDVLRLEPETVTVQPDRIVSGYGTAVRWPDTPGLTRIDSPNPGLLTASAVIRACVALERAALNYVDGAPPIDYFSPADPTFDPFEDDDEVKAFLDRWRETRRQRGTGYVPAGVNYQVGGWDPSKLQLAEAREFAITEVARMTGIDSEDLSVSTTSRTYFNAQDRRRDRIEAVLGPYMTAIEGRLSLEDVTPRGYTVAFDTSTFLRLDDLGAAQADQALVSAEIITRDEARAKRGLAPLGPTTPPSALPAPQEPANA